MQGRVLAVAALLLLVGCAPVADARVGAAPAQGEEREEEIVDDLRERRERLRAHWEELGEREEGLERYALFVQAVMDAAAEAGATAKAVFLDDLVDLSVPPDYDKVKRSVMASPLAYRGPLVHEDDSGLDGFARRFRVGEGRYRHLAMSAAAAFRYPGPLVDVAARIVGHDLEPRASSGGDSAADVATNEVGRRFAAFLRDTPLARLADGETVAAWLREAFGE